MVMMMMMRKRRMMESKAGLVEGVSEKMISRAGAVGGGGGGFFVRLVWLVERDLRMCLFFPLKMLKFIIILALKIGIRKERGRENEEQFKKKKKL